MYPDEPLAQRLDHRFGQGLASASRQLARQPVGLGVLDAECHTPIHLPKQDTHHTTPERNPGRSLGRSISAKSADDLATALVGPEHVDQRDDLDGDSGYI